PWVGRNSNVRGSHAVVIGECCLMRLMPALRRRPNRPHIETLECRRMLALHPLSAVPALNSDPAAADGLYLDFVGDNTPNWGSNHPGTTPAFTTDGDPTTFSDSELADINEIWSRVAEKFSPFNLNVTTV